MVTFYYSNQTACSLCDTNNLYDAIKDISFNVLCPICKGTYCLDNAVAVEVLARVHWVNDEAITATPGGKYYLGQATLTINIDDLETAQKAQSESGKVVIDDHDMQITKIIPMGFDINRYRVICNNMGDRQTS